MTIIELIEMNNEMMKEQKRRLNHFKYMQKTRNKDYSTEYIDKEVANQEQCFEYLKEVDKMIHLLDTLLECTHISKKRKEAYNLRTEKMGTALEYKINSTIVTRRAYHLVKRTMEQEEYY